MIETLKLNIRGVAPLMVHNGQLADPTNRYAREMKMLSKKKGKTDEDLETMRRVEWEGGLYLDPNRTVGLPCNVVLAALIRGARKMKQGKQVEAGVFDAEPFFPIVHDGPDDIDEMYADGRFCDYRPVNVGGRRVMRARPIFPQWSITAVLCVNPDIIDPSAVRSAMDMAGAEIGICEWRPRLGRFEVLS